MGHGNFRHPNTNRRWRSMRWVDGNWDLSSRRATEYQSRPRGGREMIRPSPRAATIGHFRTAWVVPGARLLLILEIPTITSRPIALPYRPYRIKLSMPRTALKTTRFHNALTCAVMRAVTLLSARA